MKKLICISIFGLFVSTSVFASTICESFIHGREVLPPYLQLHETLCAFDLQDLEHLKFEDKVMLDSPQYGIVFVLKGDSDQYAIVTDLASNAEKLLDSQADVNGNFIVSAFAWCVVSPLCRGVLTGLAWGAVKFFAGAAAGGYAWDKAKEYYSDIAGDRCNNR